MHCLLDNELHLHVCEMIGNDRVWKMKNLTWLKWVAVREGVFFRRFLENSVYNQDEIHSSVVHWRISVLEMIPMSYDFFPLKIDDKRIKMIH